MHSTAQRSPLLPSHASRSPVISQSPSGPSRLNGSPTKPTSSRMSQSPRHQMPPLQASTAHSTQPSRPQMRITPSNLQAPTSQSSSSEVNQLLPTQGGGNDEDDISMSNNGDVGEDGAEGGSEAEDEHEDDNGDDDDEEDEDEEDEGEGEDGEDGDEDESEDDEEDEDGDDDKSEDLEGGEQNDFEVTDVKRAEGDGAEMQTVKAEPGEEGAATEAAGASGEGEATNVLVPKKKPKRRAVSEDLPAPPPPMKTIRLERKLPLKRDETLVWNILEDARDAGMIAELPVEDDGVEDVMDVDGEAGPSGSGGQGEGEQPALPATTNGVGQPGPSSAGLGFMNLDGDAEEIARRLEEKYGDAQKPKVKKIKRPDPTNVYDLNDDFIDDSELTIDAPTHVARPKKEGFYVHSGPLELMEEEAPKKSSRPPYKRPKMLVPLDRPTLSALVAQRNKLDSQHVGTRDSPIPIDSDDEAKAGPSKPRLSKSPSPEPLEPIPVDRVLFKNASRDPALLPPFPDFPKDVSRRLLELQHASCKHSWPSERAKFPENLKEPLRIACHSTYKHDMFGTRDDEQRFFKALPSVLPYNNFTLTKLAFKTCLKTYWSWLEECETEGIGLMAEQIELEKDAELERYEAAMTKWREEMSEWERTHPNGSTNANGDPTMPASDHTAVDGDNGDAPQPAAVDGRPSEPRKRFTFSQDIKAIFRQLLENSIEMAYFNDKARDMKVAEAKSRSDANEKGLRANLYKKLSAIFPDGWESTSDLSKEMQKLRLRRPQIQDHTKPPTAT